MAPGTRASASFICTGLTILRLCCSTTAVLMASDCLLAVNLLPVTVKVSSGLVCAWMARDGSRNINAKERNLINLEYYESIKSARRDVVF